MLHIILHHNKSLTIIIIYYPLFLSLITLGRWERTRYAYYFYESGPAANRKTLSADMAEQVVFFYWGTWWRLELELLYTCQIVQMSSRISASCVRRFVLLNPVIFFRGVKLPIPWKWLIRFGIVLKTDRPHGGIDG